jgi:hypothetical protein
MVLNSASVMPRLTRRYCGVAWYFANSAFQAASLSGGMVPLTGCHSVIDRPDSVSRVAPPTSTMAKISAATAMSQRRIARRRMAWIEVGSRMSDACAAAGEPYTRPAARRNAWRHAWRQRDSRGRNLETKCPSAGAS